MMKRIITCLFIVVSTITYSQPIKAHHPEVVLSAFGTAAIDGVMSSGEWDSAGTVEFEVDILGDGIAPGRIYVMNDSDNLYIAVWVGHSIIGSDANKLNLRFDNDHNGIWPENGDDYLFSRVRENIESHDMFMTGGYHAYEDHLYGGTKDLQTGFSNEEGFTVYEVSHPVNSTDDEHDFSLYQGDTVGFNLYLSMRYPDSPWPDGTTRFPSVSSGPTSFGDIIIAPICWPNLPKPLLVFKGAEYYIGSDGHEYTRYRLEVENFSDYPDELFTPAPHLPPCGLNENASRTWVDIFDDSDNRLYGFCAFDSSDDLTKIWFGGVPKGSSPPDSVYIRMIDRECNIQYISNYVDICTDSDGDNYYEEVSYCGPTDCDDNNYRIYPGATEICNGEDDDCDTDVDEGVKLIYHPDADGDGFGDPGVTALGCTPPSGYVSNGSDCDDTNTNINPDATEICNDIDDDCDTQVDEGVKLTFYMDSDGDGYGDVSNTTQACAEPEGYVFDSSDCDDTRSNVNPSATEVCNDRDDNCNKVIDEGVLITFYLDADEDGYGDISFPIEACREPVGYASNSTDCNDDDALISPAAAEMCFDHIDNDCDTLTDCDDINCEDELACASDVDGDGVPDFLEMGPSGTDGSYDGDNSGKPDYEENTAVSCYCYGGFHYVTLSCPMALANVNVVPIPPNPPEDISFPFGFFEFTIDVPTNGGSAKVTIILDEEVNTFYKYGPTIVGTLDPAWYEFLFDAVLLTGAEFDGFTVTVHYVDGALGDDDLTENGLIVDKGGPGISVSQPEPQPSGGGGGGCSIVGVKMSIEDALAGYGLLFVAGVLWGIRRRRNSD